MPYIKETDREKFENLVKTMCLTHINTPGELNYLFTHLIHAFLNQKGRTYQHYNDAIGALEGCKLELYRQYVSKYEDAKIIENGFVP